MTWTQKQNSDYEIVDAEKATSYDQSKEAFLPVREKHGSKGQILEPFRPQPVTSPGIYEADFVVRGDDILFHFQPHGHAKAIEAAFAESRKAEKDVKPRLPNFKTGFEQALRTALEEQFDANRLDVVHDTELHSFFVRATGYGVNQFHREKAIAVCKKLHLLMGGDV